MHMLSRDQVLITSDDLHAAVSICAIVLLVIAIISTLGRVFTKIIVMRKLTLDDYVIFVALLFSAAQTAVVLMASGHGLGRHWSTLSSTERTIFQRSLYAAGLLFIPATAMTKLSIIIFVRGLTPMSSHRQISLVFGAGVVLWVIGSEFAAGFACNPQGFSDGGSCLNKVTFWNSFNILNILTEMLLIIWPSMIVSNIRTSLSRRLAIIACFASRLLVVGAVIAQLIFTNRTSGTIDPSYGPWSSVLCIQVVQAVSITTASIPYLRPFLESLESGLLRSDDLRRRGLDESYGHPSSNDRKNSGFTTKISERRETITPAVALRSFNHVENSTTIEAKPWPGDDAQSDSSQTRIINHTTSWTVNTEPARTSVSLKDFS